MGKDLLRSKAEEISLLFNIADLKYLQVIIMYNNRSIPSDF